MVLTQEGSWQNPSDKESGEVIFHRIHSQLFAMGDLLTSYRNRASHPKGPWNNAAFPSPSILFSWLRNTHKKFLYSGKTTSPCWCWDQVCLYGVERRDFGVMWNCHKPQFKCSASSSSVSQRHNSYLQWGELWNLCHFYWMSDEIHPGVGGLAALMGLLKHHVT